ncbi:hypothetical protein [Litoreibacter halocynthiae]|nr:hypothetical protein [Litoreibacter halocynthiae]
MKVAFAASKHFDEQHSRAMVLIETHILTAGRAIVLPRTANEGHLP